ncbi:phosphatidylglycerol lysyltransferase domain-containing protein, partial [Acinetobacter nosocomialis]|uniref:phosphatidylglycerol lysyltransferase domain-containing protein n=1 Tax=Acinetobacter nosocomialis TaxID=106654 RepID=UPI000E6ABEB8
LSPEPFLLISIVLLVAGSTWLGFFAYHHVIYSDDLWWQFSYKNDVSRFLRSSIVIAVLLVAIFIWQLFGISRPEHIEQLDESELNDIENILHQTHDTQGFLALLGDKKIFWSEDRSAFIAYATTKKYWIAMGDPVGTSSAFGELLWKFKEQADRFGAKIVFYQISEEYLPIYLDLGLSLLKLL